MVTPGREHQIQCCQKQSAPEDRLSLSSRTRWRGICRSDRKYIARAIRSPVRAAGTIARHTRVASQSGGLRNLHLGIGTGCRCVNGGNNKVHMSAKIGPPLLEQHDDSNLPHCKILLVALVFVSRYKNVKASAFGGIEQIAVLISAPTFARGRADRYGPRETERAVQASPDRIEPALGDIL
jgi:hypothetical protein